MFKQVGHNLPIDIRVDERSQSPQLLYSLFNNNYYE
jgi:hypothetical protein